MEEISHRRNVAFALCFNAANLLLLYFVTRVSFVPTGTITNLCRLAKTIADGNIGGTDRQIEFRSGNIACWNAIAGALISGNQMVLLYRVKSSLHSSGNMKNDDDCFMKWIVSFSTFRVRINSARLYCSSEYEGDNVMLDRTRRLFDVPLRRCSNEARNARVTDGLPRSLRIPVSIITRDYCTYGEQIKLRFGALNAMRARVDWSYRDSPHGEIFGFDALAIR